MSGWNPSHPPWETQDQPALSPDDDSWYARAHGPRVVIRPHDRLARGTRGPAPARGRRRGVVLAGVAAALVAAGAIGWGAVRLTHGTSGSPAAAPTTPGLTVSPNDTSAPATPTSTPPASPTTPASGGAGAGPAYTLTTPPTAGGYTLTTPMTAAIKEANSSAATALMQGGAAAGGRQASEVTGEYLIRGDQALGYSGFTGTFTPQVVINAFGMMATGVASEPAGKHGGLLSCGTVTETSPAPSTGTACVWATPTTIALVEFFGADALEQVTMSRAGQDAANFRADVEVPKG